MFIGCCLMVSMLLHQQAQRLSLEEDSNLLSKVAFLITADDQSQQLWWSLDFMYDRFKFHGEKRKLHKWIQFFTQGVGASGVCDQEFFCHTKRNDLPDVALRENVATTKSIFSFLYFTLRESRTPSILNFVRQWLPALCSRVSSTLQIAQEVPVEDMLSLTVYPGGQVTGLEDMLSDRHRTSFVAWSNEWKDMYEKRDLSEPLLTGENSAVSLQELVKFVFSVEKKKRSAGTHPWSADSVSGSSLRRVQKAIVHFMAAVLDVFVIDWYIPHHDTSRLPAARRRSGEGLQHEENFPGQVAIKKKQRVSMNVESIWEVLCQERDSSLTTKQALEVLKKPSLAQTGGCTGTAVDSWQRRSQELYDERAALSMLGTSHFNLISDSSTHAGRELLVSILYSHENNCAAFANNQVILPLNIIAPSELELTSMVEQLAKDDRVYFFLFLWSTWVQF